MKRKIFTPFVRVLILATVTALCFGMLPACGKEDNEPVFRPDMSAVGVWWWNHNAGDEYLAFAAKNGVTEIYYSVPPELLLENAPAFISKAGAKGIYVYFLSGEYDWINNYQDFRTVMDKFTAYQASAAGGQKFAGVHLDVEPHQDPLWNAGNRAALLQKYIDFVVRACADYKEIDFDIPFWFTDEVEYSGGKTELYKAVMTEAARVFIMSYRDSAEKMYNLGSVPEQIEFAEALDKPVFLCAEADYPDEGGTVISYGRSGKAAMYGELNKLKDLVLYDKLGVSIHHIQSWFALKN